MEPLTSVPEKKRRPVNRLRLSRGALSLTVLFLAIEFFDELHYGIQGAALPSLRLDLVLSYAQVGMLLGLPHVIGSFVEPFLMLLGDTRLRKRLVVGGGLVIVCSLLLVGSARSFPAALVAFILAFPASGAFVSLSQATLMDLNPGREPQSMARWSAAGSLGNLLGPLFLAGGFALAIGWRWAYLGLAGLALCLALLIWGKRFPDHTRQSPGLEKPSGSRANLRREMLHNLLSALRTPALLRWVVLLELADLMMDMYTSYVPLYLADVAHFSPAQTSLALTLLMAASLGSDMLLIPLLERFPGRSLVRLSALLALIIFSAWLLVPGTLAKIILMVLVRFSTIGWYAVLQGEAYASVPGRSGTVMALNSVGGIAGGALVWLIGWVAGLAGLPTAMSLMLLGPISLLVLVPRAAHTAASYRSTP